MSVMEHHEPSGQLRTTWKWIAAITVVVVAATVVFTMLKPVTYTTSVSFSINRINKEQSAYYEYDGYYAIQAADLISQTVVSWFLTPSVLLEIYETAGVDPAIDSLNEFAARFKTRKHSSQNVVVTFTERDEANGEKLGAAVIEVVEEMGAGLNQSSDAQALYGVVGSTPVIVEDQADWPITVAVGVLAGLILGTGFVTVRYYFRS